MVVAMKRLWIQISTDKRRLSVLCTAVAIGLLLWARVIVIARMPRQAVADDPKAIVEPERGDAASEQELNREKTTVALERVPRRNPFVISPTHFPESTPVTDLRIEEEKSEPEQVEDQEHARARMLVELGELVKLYSLEAVMTGSPMAVISGETYRLGDWIPAIDHEQVRFRLVEVQPRSVILAYEDHRFQIRIADPGDRD